VRLLWAALAGLLTAAAPNERSILADLERLDQGLAQAEIQVRQSETERAKLQGDLAGIESALATAKLRQAAAYKQYVRRVRALARQPVGARLALLGGAGTLAEYLQTTRLLRWVASHDKQLHAHYVAESVRLTSLEEQRGTRRRELEAVVQNSRARRDTLAGQRRERADLLQSVRAERSKAEQLAQERRAAQEKLRAMVAKLAPAAAPGVSPTSTSTDARCAATV
jgi:septal ring factor EnvC (AmiA/AmiB activator)